MNVIVTGGLGFIGSHFIELLLKETDWEIHCLDSETYAADLKFKSFLNKNERVKLHCCDISNSNNIAFIKSYLTNIDAIVHFAAESHVDNSISGPLPFVNTNVMGTFNLLEYARNNNIKKFVHVSTDEVYGAIEENEIQTKNNFLENDILNPSSVYSSTKAASDLIVNSYFKTYKLNICITRCCNNYGTRQNKEKFLPKTILNALNELPIPVYGKGKNIREWIHVDDHCSAIFKVLVGGKPGEIYNIGTGHILENLSLVYRVLCVLNKEESLIKFVEDRKGHDFKYAINFDKIKNELDWRPSIKFNQGLEQVIDFYKNNL